jgi:signal-transduction protein with cAMP-binding, CBS, and nucleotidyltransferase domain
VGRFERFVAFGVGYVAGTRFGERPALAIRDGIAVAREAMATARLRIETTTDVARRRVADASHDARERASAVARGLRSEFEGRTRVATATRMATVTAARPVEGDVVMVDDPVVPSVDVDTLVRDAAALMAVDGADRVRVIASGRTLGVVTDRDLVVLALAEGLDPMSTSVGDLLERRSG